MKNRNILKIILQSVLASWLSLLFVFSVGVGMVSAATAPSVTTSAVSDITSTTAKFVGNLSSLGSATSVAVSFEYGRTSGYGSVTASQTMTSTGGFSVDITGLTQGVSYHVRAKADGGTAGVAYGSDITFGTSTIPSVTTDSASYITKDSATVNGNLTNMGSASSINVYFQYGTTTAYGNVTTSKVITGITAFNIDISGLTAATTYHYRAVADGGVKGTAFGDDKTFFTLPVAPIVTEITATNVSYTTATLRGNLTTLGTASSVKVHFEYGTTTSYGITTSKIEYTAAGVIDPVKISSLTPGTRYHYRIIADGGINGVTTGSDLTFTTREGVTPKIGTASYSDLTYYTVTLVGNLATKGSASSVTCYFEYGTTTDYGTTIDPEKKPSGVGLSGGFYAYVTGLKPGTTYHFRAVVDGGTYGMGYSDDITFETPGSGAVKLPEVVSYDATSITANSATINGELSTLGDSSSVYLYFEYGTSTSYGSTTDKQLVKTTGTFTADITGLVPGTLYHYRTIADDSLRTIVKGNDMTFTTFALTPGVTTLAASDITDTTASLNGKVDSLGTASSVKVYFDWGVSSFYGKTISVQSTSAAGSFTVPLTGLKLGTEYHFRIKVDGGTSGIITGSDMSFKTLDQPMVSVDSSSLAISPKTVYAGDNVSVTATVSNTSKISSSYTVIFAINSVDTETKQIEIPAASSQDVSFTTAQYIAGTYQVSINGVSGSFVVNNEPETTTTTTKGGTSNNQTSTGQLFLFIAVGIVIVVGIAIVLVRKYEHK